MKRKMRLQSAVMFAAGATVITLLCIVMIPFKAFEGRDVLAAHLRVTAGNLRALRDHALSPFWRKQ